MFSIHNLYSQNKLSSIIEANNNFAFELYKTIKIEGENTFVSPFSVSSALAMVYAGSKNKTSTEIAKTMNFIDDINKHNELFYGLIEEVKDKRFLELKIANSIWIQKDYKFDKEYFKTVRKYYNAPLTNLDFKEAEEAEKSRKKINKWIEKNTKRKINDLIKEGMLSSKTKMVLTNAIYFYGAWNIEFDKKLTKKNDFWLDEKVKEEAEFMKKNNKMGYFENNIFQAVEIPYKNNEASLIILLPKDYTFDKLENELSGENFKKWNNAFTNHRVELTMPKFKITSYFELSKALSKMGMHEAFSNKADLSGITGKKDLRISNVLHKTFIEVNEKGTKAAAATSVLVMRKTSISKKAKKFNANHPFIFLIKEHNTNSILFIGNYNKPAKLQK